MDTHTYVYMYTPIYMHVYTCTYVYNTQTHEYIKICLAMTNSIISIVITCKMKRRICEIGIGCMAAVSVMCAFLVLMIPVSTLIFLMCSLSFWHC